MEYQSEGNVQKRLDDSRVHRGPKNRKKSSAEGEGKEKTKLG